MEQTQVPHANKGKTCPLHKQDMSLVCHKCPWWTHLVGKHPQGDHNIDQWGCAVSWLPILLIEGAQQSRGTQAAVESFRNEMANNNMSVLHMIAQRARQQAQHALDGPKASAGP